MGPPEIRAILCELVSFCAKNEWGQMTTAMTYPIHEKLSGALSAPRTRGDVRRVLSEELAETPAHILAYYATIHAVEDGDIDTISELAVDEREDPEEFEHGAVAA